MEQSSTTFRCLRCPETRTSQRALNRHIKWHQRTANTAVAEPAVLSMDCVPSASRDLRVTSGLLEPPSILDDNPDQARKHRKLVDVAVGRLKRRHERDRTTLSLPTAELANWLVEKEPDLSLLCASASWWQPSILRDHRARCKRSPSRWQWNDQHLLGRGRKNCQKTRFAAVCFLRKMRSRALPKFR